MEEINKLEKRIDHVQFDEINSMKEDISNIKIDLAKNNLLTKQSVDSTDKLSSTLDTVKDTMIHLSNSMEQSNRSSTELNKKVDNLEIKFDSIEQKGYIDWLQWVKDNWFGTFLGLGAVGYAISQFIK